jgi:hypothetical protein
VTYGFSLVPGQTITRPRNLEIALPATLTALREQAHQGLGAIYTKGMDELLSGMASEFYPAGKSSLDAMREIPSHTAPEVYFKTNNTNLWALSDLEYKGQSLPGGEYITMTNTGGVSFLQLRRPASLAAKDLFTKPRVAMDLILQSVRVNRTVGAAETRILSYGDPVQVRRVTDSHGRVWWSAVWHQEFCDQVKILYATLTPDGLAMLLREDEWPALDNWHYDLTRMLDLVSVGYRGTPKQWKEYLAMDEAVPAFLKRTTLALGEGGLSLESPWIRFEVPKSLLPLDEEAKLQFNFGFEPGPAAPRPTLRRLRLTWGTDEYMTMLKHLRTPDDSPEETQKRWTNLVEQRAPYDRKLSLEEGQAIMARVHPAQSDRAELRKTPAIYTVYLSQAQGAKESEMGKRLDALAAALRLPDLGAAEPKAAGGH